MCHGFQLAMLNYQSHQLQSSESCVNSCQAAACPKDSSGTNVPRPKKNGPGPVVSALEFRREKW
jgi:hypothetical protein